VPPSRVAAGGFYQGKRDSLPVQRPGSGRVRIVTLRRRFKPWECPVFDYHVHSQNSVDCNFPIQRQCEAAIAAGVTELAITDHMEQEKADPGWGYYRPDVYFRELDEAREEFAGRLTLLRGVEVDFNYRTAPLVEKFIEEYGAEYDFIIGSVHYGDGGEIIFPEYFASRSLDEVIVPYLDNVKMAVETGWFSTIGHIDLPKRYTPKTHRTYDPLAYREHLQPIFASMIANNIGFEINTSGLRQTPKTSMPGPAVVRWYSEAGGKMITTGTDSHAPQTIGAGLARTLDMLQLCGIDTVASFRKRQATLVPIETLRAAN
jgi:histidinol-phosphatase (PHP family)